MSLTCKMSPFADQARHWASWHGHRYRRIAAASSGGSDSKDSQRTRQHSPAAELGRQGTLSGTTSTGSRAPQTQTAEQGRFELDRLAEESMHTHLLFGSYLLDQNPITGRPGEFHLSVTERAAAAARAAAAQASLAAKKNVDAGIGGIGRTGLANDTKHGGSAGDGTRGASTKKDGARTPKTPKTPKSPKSPKSPTSGRLKKRRSSNVAAAA